MVKYVKVESRVKPVFKALPYGTKLYLKTTDDIVREVKIIGGEFRADKEGYVRIFYKYQIAGLAGSFYGTESVINDNGVRGSFYTKIECITQGVKSNLNGAYEPHDIRVIFNDYIHKAGNCRSKGQEYDFLYIGGCGYDTVYFKATKLAENGITYQTDTQFNLWFDENGWHGDIPAIDNGEMYYNVEDALSHYKPLVVTFADSGEVEEPKDEEITISVKIKKSDVEKLKNICKVL